MKFASCVQSCKNRRWCFTFKGLSAIFTVPYFKCVFLCVVVAMVTMTYFSTRIPFSPLFQKYNIENEVFGKVNQQNEQRLEKAKQYFKNLDNHTSLEFYKARSTSPFKPEVVVCIVSVSRKRNMAKTGYLLQTAAVADQIIKKDRLFPNMFMFVCNVDKYPANHSDAVLLQSYMPYVQKNGSNFWNKNFPVENVTLLHKIQTRGKEIADYTFCLNVSYSFGSPYVLMLEDDVVPYKYMFDVIHYTLKQHNLVNPRVRLKGLSKRRQFAFLKLYYPERWQGYAKEVDRMVELVSVAVVGGGIMYAVFSLITYLRKSTISHLLRSVYFCIFCFLSGFMAALYGRQNVIDLRRVSPALFKFVRTPACCTPAMFYSSHVIPSLISYLLKHSEINKDLAIYDFINESSIPGYIIEPNLVRHIGMYTSLQDAHKTPYDFVSVNL